MAAAPGASRSPSQLMARSHGFGSPLPGRSALGHRSPGSMVDAVLPVYVGRLRDGIEDRPSPTGQPCSWSKAQSSTYGSSPQRS